MVPISRLSSYPYTTNQLYSQPAHIGVTSSLAPTHETNELEHNRLRFGLDDSKEKKGQYIQKKGKMSGVYFFQKQTFYF